MALPPTRSINPLRIAHMQRLQHSLQPILRLWYSNNVYMVCHQAVRQNIYSVALTIRTQMFKVKMPVIIVEKHIFTTITTLGNVMRYTCKYRSSYSGHT